MKTTLKNWITRHNLLTFYILAFLWSWLWWLSLIFSTPPGAFLAGDIPPAFFALALLGGLGPSIAGFVVSRILDKNGPNELFAGLKKPFRWQWILFSLFLVPALTVVQALIHALSGREVTYNFTPMMLVMGIAWPLFSSFGEEFGWRGFVLPKMLGKRSPLVVSLILGFIWGMWHLPADYIAYSAYGWWFLPLFLLLGPINLMAHSVIMTYIYKKTGGNLLAMVIYHFTITMSSILSPSFSFGSYGDNVLKSAVSVAVIVAAAVVIAVFSKTMGGRGFKAVKETPAEETVIIEEETNS
ncbi:MAG TPA: CPBP family intramembrane metalloprotease [Eubacteriales bacterium]|nr:CPBP family intramembrane metalloprotease [Eubacteriales bacterium]